jgi:hypothetical protein
MINLLAMYHRNVDAEHFPFTPEMVEGKLIEAMRGNWEVENNS